MRTTRTTARILLALAIAAVAPDARAGITIETKDGWTFTVGGFVNAFAVSESGDAAPHPDLYGRASKDSNFRIRTGLLPGLIGFGVTAPEVNGVKTAGRVGFWPQVNGNAGARTTINGANIDLRELNFTVDGTFGQVLVGRALTLYQGKNILTDMSLYGVGVSGPFDNGPTLGHIGIGYLYPSFDAQVRYTTPDLGGLKLALAVVDPAAPAAGASLSAPTFEAELSASGKGGSMSWQAFASATYQSSKVAGTTITSAGAAGGAGVGFSGLDLLASGFYGSGVGTTGVMNSALAIDGANKPRTTSAFLVQATYTMGAFKVGANFSRLGVTKTDADKATPDPALLDSRQAFTGGVWYDLTPAVKLVGEVTRADLKFEDAAKQASTTVAVGGFFFF